MGRKKPSARDEESALVGGGKSKKKAFVINDDEYSIGTDLSEEPLEEKVVPPIDNKKGKKGGSKREEDDDVGDIKFGEVDVDEDEPVMKFAGKKKSKGKKSGNNNSFSSSAFGLLGEDEDEGGDVDKNGNDEEDEKEDEEEEVRQTVTAFSGKKKPSKNNKTSGKMSSAFDLLQEEDESEKEEEDDVSDPVVTFSGKKKASKSKKSGGNASSAFDLLQEEDEGEENVESPTEHEDEDVSVSFSGKKKKKKSSKTSGNLFSAAILDEENDDYASVSKIEDDLKVDAEDDAEDDLSALNFSGKKKSSKKKNASTNAASEIGYFPASSDFLESRQPPAESKTDNPTIDNAESSKNKKKKKKGGKGAQEEEDLDKILAELGEAPSVSKAVDASLSVPDEPPNQPELQEAVDDKEDKEEEPLESVKNAAKNKKKKKKVGKTAQDEDDLDKILTEIDGAPPVTEPAPSSVETPAELAVVVGDKEAEDEGLAESAAAKKKKKKKAKDKKAAAEEKQEETTTEVSNKISDKKVPKHVREMQERLAKLKEAEEKKKREEEERLRKEEEERRRLEELERQAEEKKRLKKEKEKEKLLKKKQEGKLLTGKQKEEARRLEAMRNQILAAGGLQIPTGESITKRPVYQKKKPKPQAQSNGSTVVDATSVDVIESSDSIETMQEVASDTSSVEPENVQETAPSNEDLSDTVDVVEENEVAEEDDDDEDWDAKSWDDADLKLPGTFSDEEINSEPEPLPKKEVKIARPATIKEVEPPSKATKPAGLNEKVSSSVLHIPEKVKERKIKDIEPEVARKNEDKTPVAVDNKNSNSQNEQNLRSPICCIMGHVDTGKTKLLDCIRGTNVQEGEAGGITQQIGATYFPADNIRERTKELKADAKLNVPGLLVIDTPGHESFTNLRSRGSGLCDIAILVVDIMHGLEPQTIESLNLLKMRNTEFIVALNKVDRLYGWKTCRNAPITKAMKQQSKDVQIEFNMRLTQVITQFKEQGLNTELYYKNKEMGETFSIVPTSAISGEGIPDLLLLLVQWAQKTMISRLTYIDEVQCTVLEVKVVEGHGTTIDVVLVNGVLHEGDQIIVCGLQGPIVTTIRALLTPHPMKELRVKGSFLHHKEIKAAQGIKITAQGLEHAIAGTSLYLVKPGDDLEEIKETAMEDMKSVMNRIDKSGEGVYVQASTLGSLEALLEFLKSPAVSIPVSGISIGPVHKKDVMKASVMLEKKKEYGTILAFDVKVTPEARDLAEELGVKIFIADIIYHLFDQFKAYIDNLKEEKKKQASEEAVFPCVLKIIPNCVFNTKDPIVLGVDILEGIAKIGTPICVPQRDFIDIGRIASIENNHKPVDYAKKGQKVAIKIIGSNPEEQQKMFGRHFEIEDELVSKISRSSLDALKEHYRDDLSVEEKRLLFKLKNLFKIP